MNRVITSFLFLLAPLFSFSQESTNWLELMKDGDVPLQEIVDQHNAYWEGKTIKKGSGWKQFKRWEALMTGRTRDDGRVYSGEDYMRAYEAMQELSATRSPSGNWKPLGPILDEVTTRDNIRGVGRINCMAFHPTDDEVIFIGTPAGGLWRTYDNGESWESNTDDLPTLGVSAVVFDPSAPNIVYMGTGDRDHADNPGMGVYKSTDSGITWTAVNDGMESLTVGDMLINGNDPNILMAGTNQGIWRTEDGGSNWEQVSNNNDYGDMAFKPGDFNTVYATGNGKFYKSVDGGVNWEWVNDGIQSAARMVIAVTPANPELVYVCSATTYEFHKFYKSSDSGTNFVTQSDSPNILGWAADGSGDGGQAWYDLCMAADPVDSNIVYVGGIRMKKSIDGGQTWLDINPGYLHVDQHECSFSPYNGDLYLANDGGFYQYIDNQDWQDISEGFVNGQIYRFGQSPHSGARALIGLQDNGTMEYDGAVWQRVGGGDGFEAWYDHSDPTWTYGSLYYGRIYRTSPDFVNQQICGEGVLDITEGGAWITPYVLSYDDPNSMFVGLKNVWRCTNVKEPELDNLVWEKISNNLAGNNNENLTVVELSASNPNVIYATENANRKLFRCDSIYAAEPEWQSLSAQLPFLSQPVTAIESHPTADSIVFIGFGGQVFKSTDYGSNWEDITGSLPGLPISTLIYDKNTDEGLYVGTDYGIFYRDATMDDWIPFSDGFPLASRVMELEIYYGETIEDSKLRACTYGRGFWESDLYGAETFDFPAQAFFVDNSYDEEVFDDFSVDVRFYRNTQLIEVDEFAQEDIYIEGASISNFQELEADHWRFDIDIAEYGPINIVVEDLAAIDDQGLATIGSDTITIYYNPPPEPFAHLGPGGVGDDTTIPVWFRAHDGALLNNELATDSSLVDTWQNFGSGPNATQGVDSLMPRLFAGEDGINGYSTIHFDGDNDFISAEGVLPGQNLTVVTLASADNTVFQDNGWFASSRGPNGFVIHPWQDDDFPFYSPLVYDAEGNIAEGTKQYLVDGAAPHIYGLIYERFDYNQMFMSFFDESEWVYPASLGPRDESAPITINYGWDEGDNYGAGKLAEHFIYNRRLHISHLHIVRNYLAAKYGVNLGQDDRYAHETFIHHLGGIGRVSEYDYHDDAQGTGSVRVSNPADLDDEEYLMWAQDDLPLEWISDGYPILSSRLETTWGIDQTGDLGTVTFRILVSDIPDISEEIGVIVGSGSQFAAGQNVDFYPLTLQGEYYETELAFPEFGVFTIGVEPEVSIEEILAENVTIWPNPTTSEINVNVKNIDRTDMNFIVRDGLGRIVDSINSSGPQVAFDASDWSAGVYLLTIELEGNSVTHEVMKF